MGYIRDIPEQPLNVIVLTFYLLSIGFRYIIPVSSDGDYPSECRDRTSREVPTG
jgi:hypothetical protein